MSENSELFQDKVADNSVIRSGIYSAMGNVSTVATGLGVAAWKKSPVAAIYGVAIAPYVAGAAEYLGASTTDDPYINRKRLAYTLTATNLAVHTGVAGALRIGGNRPVQNRLVRGLASKLGTNTYAGLIDKGTVWGAEKLTDIPRFLGAGKFADSVVNTIREGVSKAPMPIKALAAAAVIVETAEQVMGIGGALASTFFGRSKESKHNNTIESNIPKF